MTATTDRRRVALALAVLAFAAAFGLAPFARATRGSPDSTIAAGGQTASATFPGGDDGANAAALDSSGRIVVVATHNYRFVLLRYTPNGELDESFGSGGEVTTRSLVGHANTGTIDSSGRILVTGTTFAAGPVLVRYRPDGSLDPTFGNGGGATEPRATAADALALDPPRRIRIARAAGSRHGQTLARHTPTRGPARRSAS